MAKKKDEFEICVACGEVTEYLRSIPIELRAGYVEGVGQLCTECCAKIYPSDLQRRHFISDLRKFGIGLP